MSLLANSNAIESGGYNIDRSLRFRSSASAYLNRTPASAGNRQKFTWSGWVKRGAFSSTQTLFVSRLDDNNSFQMRFNSTDVLAIYGQWNGTSNEFLFITNQVFRDPSAWYHIVFAFDSTQATSANRMFLYVNGQQVSSFSSSTYPPLNLNSYVNAANPHYISNFNSSYYFDGYLAEVNFIDGQALTPSSFGETSTETGVWAPKKYTGTYGTNGFYLPFSDNTSATTLAYDKSGNGNNWTANNISTTAGATYDSMTDVPTLTSATAANYCVLNPLNGLPTGASITNGNLTCVTPTSGNKGIIGSFAIPSSGKWYWEFTPTANGIDSFCGIGSYTDYNPGVSYFANGGNKYVNGSGSAYGASYTNNDVIGVAVDVDNSTVTFYKNNSSQGAISYSTAAGLFPYFNDGSGSASTTIESNFGQRPFSYTPPTGFKALNTFNLPDPTIKKPNQYMDATLWVGNGTSQIITNIGEFQPDFVWIKTRDISTSHVLTDSVRGNTKYLFSNNTNTESTVTDAVTSFNSNGFSLSLNGAVNGNSTTYVGWQWKESATAGFDIVTYTGTGSALNVNHSLGVAPKFMIVKDRSATNPWPVYHASLGSQYYILLNATSAADNSLSNYWGASGPSSTTFTVGPYGGNNTNGNNYVAYLFAEIPQFSKAFSFTGNGSADGSFVYLGFKPKLVLLKCSSTTGNWYMFDTVRNTYNVLGEQLYPNLSNAGSTVTTLDALSNGFKMRLAGDPNAAQTYIGFAWADTPVKYSGAF